MNGAVGLGLQSAPELLGGKNRREEVWMNVSEFSSPHTPCPRQGQRHVRPGWEPGAEAVPRVFSHQLHSAAAAGSEKQAGRRADENNRRTNFIRLADKPGSRESQSALHVSASPRQPRGQEARSCSHPKFSPAPSAQGRLPPFSRSLTANRSRLHSAAQRHPHRAGMKISKANQRIRTEKTK